MIYWQPSMRWQNLVSTQNAPARPLPALASPRIQPHYIPRTSFPAVAVQAYAGVVWLSLQQYREKVASRTTTRKQQQQAHTGRWLSLASPEVVLAPYK